MSQHGGRGSSHSLMYLLLLSYCLFFCSLGERARTASTVGSGAISEPVRCSFIVCHMEFENYSQSFWYISQGNGTLDCSKYLGVTLSCLVEHLLSINLVVSRIRESQISDI